MWGAWIVATVLETGMLAVVSRERWPMFHAFLMFDVPRSLILMALAAAVAPKPFDDYVKVFRVTDPAIVALTLAAAIEVQARLFRVQLGLMFYGLIGAMMAAVAIAVFLLMPDYDKSLGPILWLRAIADFVIVAALVPTMFAIGRFPAYAVILSSFCAIDLVGYLAILAGSRGVSTPAFIMLAQCGCFVAWVFQWKDYHQC